MQYSVRIPRSHGIVSRGLKKVVPNFYSSSVTVIYLAAQQIVQVRKGYRTMWQRCKCHAVQSRGSVPAAAGLRPVSCFVKAKRIDILITVGRFMLVFIPFQPAILDTKLVSIFVFNKLF